MAPYLWPAIANWRRSSNIKLQVIRIKWELCEALTEVDKERHPIYLLDELNDIIIAAETAKRMVQDKEGLTMEQMEGANEYTWAKNASRQYWRENE